jgi:hypothetical protein
LLLYPAPATLELLNPGNLFYPEFKLFIFGLPLDIPVISGALDLLFDSSI